MVPSSLAKLVNITTISFGCMVDVNQLMVYKPIDNYGRCLLELLQFIYHL